VQQELSWHYRYEAAAFVSLMIAAVAAHAQTAVLAVLLCLAGALSSADVQMQPSIV
jgi:hypothetical protein